MLSKNMQEGLSKPVGPVWVEGFMHGVVFTLLALGFGFVEVNYILPWMFGGYP